eukprot:TRINITY_DN14438_c0_g1_i3.p1 TRINITY_DN14438_c0_g1~~TRINITY_DN14438_c0_g1_i3.p1  ORF type:complete len:124 (-),score=21.52 TRINITY_DN14438_c0_g1_i3:354-725(-)
MGLAPVRGGSEGPEVVTKQFLLWLLGAFVLFRVGVHSRFLLEGGGVRLVPILQKLGVKHVGYGVIPEHYDIVGQAIVDAMKVALGGLFTPAVSNAWLKVYKVVKTTMIEAAAAAKTPTPKKAG